MGAPFAEVAYSAPLAVAIWLTALVVLPVRTAFAVRVDLPVPPLATPSVPEVSLLVARLGMSAATSVRNVAAPAEPLGAASTVFAVREVVAS